MCSEQRRIVSLELILLVNPSVTITGTMKLGGRTLEDIIGIDKFVRLQIIRKRMFPRVFPSFFDYPYQIRLDVAPDGLANEGNDERFVHPDFGNQARGSVPHLFLR